MPPRRVEIGPVGDVVRERVHSLRMERRMSLADLSRALEASGHPLSVSTLSTIENGGRRVDVDDLVALARAFDVFPVELLDHFPVTTAKHLMESLQEFVSSPEFKQWQSSGSGIESLVELEMTNFELKQGT